MRLIFMFLFFLKSNINAYIDPEYILESKKSATSPLYRDEYSIPEFENKSNNLRRISGSPYLAKGELLIIEGYVNDLLMYPCSNAVVKIYHANNFGYYNHTVLNKYNFAEYDSDFAGSGISVTNNLGKYSFYTIFPGMYHNRAPHIHLVVDYQDIHLETQIFFENHPINTSDPVYKSVNPKNIDTLICKFVKTEGGYKKCIFNIKLDAINADRRF